MYQHNLPELRLLRQGVVTRSGHFIAMATVAFRQLIWINRFPPTPSIIAERGTRRQEQNKQVQANRAGTLNHVTGYRLTQPQQTRLRMGRTLRSPQPMVPHFMLVGGRLSLTVPQGGAGAPARRGQNLSPGH